MTRNEIYKLKKTLFEFESTLVSYEAQNYKVKNTVVRNLLFLVTQNGYYLINGNFILENKR